MGEMKKRKTMRLHNADYNHAGAYFLTLCTKKRNCILSRIVEGDALNEAKIELLLYGKVAEKYIHQLNDFYREIKIDRYVIMPNHIHLLMFISPNENETSMLQNSIVSRFISTFKRFCNKECGENIWQYRSYDHIIRTEQDYEEHVNYICKNPTRWYYDELFVND